MVSKHKAENNFEFISFVLEWNKWNVDKNYKSCENYDFQQKSTFIWKILMTTFLVFLFVLFMFIFPFCHKIIKNKGHCMVRGILVNTSWKDQGHPADIHVSLIWKWHVGRYTQVHSKVADISLSPSTPVGMHFVLLCLTHTRTGIVWRGSSTVWERVP